MGWSVLPSLSARSVLSVVLVLVASCASTADAQNPASRALPWERAVDAGFENKGIATIDRLGTRWVLNVQCAGTHVTYLDDTKLDLESYRGAYVRARYHWVDRLVSDPRCVLPPCRDIKERVIAVDSIEKLSLTPAQASDVVRQCKVP